MLRARCPELKTHNKVQRGTEKKQGHAVGRHTETGLGRTVLSEKFTQSKAINVQHALDLRQPQRVIQIANPNTSLNKEPNKEPKIDFFFKSKVKTFTFK